MGAAGDMLMAALLELLPDHDKTAFLEKINNLELKNVKVNAEPSVKSGITGTHVSVTVGGAKEVSIDINMEDNLHEHEHDHEHEHSHDHDHSHEETDEHHHHTGLKDIEEILSGLNISDNIKKHTLGVYNLLAEAESLAHGCPVSEVHFHEVGNIDAVIDIVGVCLLIEELAPDKIIVSPVHVGSGFVRCSHGILPVPAPATAHILKGIPTFGGKIKGELCTPTGAALLKYFANDFGPMPQISVEGIGYGMGKKDFEVVNCVRVFLGESDESAGYGSRQNRGANYQVAELCCNVDDMTGEALGFACNTLMAAGALDVFTTATGMKKNRPGVILTCLCDVKNSDTLAALILKCTTTFAVRKSILDRYMLEREIKTEQTPLGKVKVKTGKGYGVIKSKLEYEDVAALAKERKLSINEIERQIWAYLHNQQENNK